VCAKWGHGNVKKVGVAVSANKKRKLLGNHKKTSQQGS